jgi:hypothetical protein
MTRRGIPGTRSPPAIVCAYSRSTAHRAASRANNISIRYSTRRTASSTAARTGCSAQPCRRDGPGGAGPLPLTRKRRTGPPSETARRSTRTGSRSRTRHHIRRWSVSEDREHHHPVEGEPGRLAPLPDQEPSREFPSAEPRSRSGAVRRPAVRSQCARQNPRILSSSFVLASLRALG